MHSQPSQPSISPPNEGSAPTHPSRNRGVALRFPIPRLHSQMGKMYRRVKTVPPIQPPFRRDLGNIGDRRGGGPGTAKFH
jgi:hypothetical protein